MLSKLPVTRVTQTGPNCVLACLESVSRDLGLEWTQATIIEKFRWECYADRESEQPKGAVTLRHVPSLILGLGLAQELQFGTGIDSLEKLAPALERDDGFLLLAIYEGKEYDPLDADVTHPSAERKLHAVRAIEVVPGKHVAAMDPNPETRWTNMRRPWSDLAGRAFHVIAGWTKPHLW